MAVHPYIVDQVRTPTIRSAYRAQFREWLWMERAHGMMLVKQGLLPEEVWADIRSGLDRVSENLTEEDLDGNLVDIYNVITQRLYKEIGEETGSRRSLEPMAII